MRAMLFNVQLHTEKHCCRSCRAKNARSRDKEGSPHKIARISTYFRIHPPPLPLGTFSAASDHPKDEKPRKRTLE